MDAFDDDTLAIPAVWRFRVQQNERNIDKKADNERVDEIADEVKGLRKAVYTLLAGIVGSSVLVSFTLFATLGSHLSG